jgi:hypothetical protein
LVRAKRKEGGERKGGGDSERSEESGWVGVLTFPLKGEILGQMSALVVPSQQYELLRVEDLERVEV